MAPRAVIGRVEEDETSGRTARAGEEAGWRWRAARESVGGHMGTRFARGSLANRMEWFLERLGSVLGTCWTGRLARGARSGGQPHILQNLPPIYRWRESSTTRVYRRVVWVADNVSTWISHAHGMRSPVGCDSGCLYTSG